MTTQIDTVTNLVSHNIQRELACAMHKHFKGIAHGRYKDEDLEREISEIYQRQMQPLHNELRAYIKESTPPKPSPIYKVIAFSIGLGALLTIAMRQKMMAAIVIIISLWISRFSENN